jgi:hypothetical protein
MWGSPWRRGVFTSYWLIAANSDPRSWKWDMTSMGGPHKCPKIPAWVLERLWGPLTTAHFLRCVVEPVTIGCI